MTPILKIAFFAATYNLAVWLVTRIIILNQNELSASIPMSINGYKTNTEKLYLKYSNKYKYIKLFPVVAKFYFKLVRDINFSRFDCVPFSDQVEISNQGKLASADMQVLKRRLEGHPKNAIGSSSGF
jgi:rhamnosyltransferase